MVAARFVREEEVMGSDSLRLAPMFLGCASALLSSAAASQGSDGATSAPTLVFRGGRLFDPEAGGTRELGQLWVAGDRIVGERAANTPMPEGALVVEAEGRTLVPGLFDLHVHVSVPGGGSGPAFQIDPVENLETHAAFGVLHVVDLHNDPASVFALRERSRVEPGLARLLGAGAAFTAPGGHGTQFGIEANSVTTLAEFDARFATLLPHRPDVVKGIVEHGGWAGLPVMPALDERLLAAIGERVRAAGLPFFVHVWTLDEAKTAARAGADVLAHGVFGGPIDDELIALMKERDVAYVPTLAVVFGQFRVARGESPYSPARLDGLLHPDLGEALRDAGAPGWAAGWEDADEAVFLANLARLHAAGVRVGAGTDAGNPVTPHGPALLFELQLYGEAGLTPAQALRCATLESARILGRERELGSLASGKSADVVMVRGDPTADLGAMWDVERVFKAGTEIDREPLRRRNAARVAPAVTLLLGSGAPPTIDDFDDGDLVSGWGGEWMTISDAMAPGGASTAAIELSESDGSGTLLLAGRLDEGFAYGPFAGLTVRWDPSAKRLVDASAAKELVVRARGTKRSFSISIDRAAVKDYNVFATMLPVGEDWQELRLPLSSFRQIGFGRPVDPGWRDVTGLTIQARNAGRDPQFGDFELELDWIRFE